jgi:hypothetical protein
MGVPSWEVPSRGSIAREVEVEVETCGGLSIRRQPAAGRLLTTTEAEDAPPPAPMGVSEGVALLKQGATVDKASKAADLTDSDRTAKQHEACNLYAKGVAALDEVLGQEQGLKPAARAALSAKRDEVQKRIEVIKKKMAQTALRTRLRAPEPAPEPEPEPEPEPKAEPEPEPEPEPNIGQTPRTLRPKPTPKPDSPPNPPRWCKKCKVVFAAPTCPASHAVFM